MSEQTGPNRTKPFKWNAKKQAAARLLAEDALSDRAIAAKVGCSRAQMSEWKLVPEFSAKIKAIVAELGERSLRYAIARRHRRVGKLDRLLKRVESVIRERSEDPDMQTIPGGKTGLVVIKECKTIGEGENRSMFIEVAFDAALVKEARELMKEASIETGQRTEKRELTGPNGGAIPIQVIEVVRPNAHSDLAS